MISGLILVVYGLLSAFSGLYLILKRETPSGQKLLNHQVGVAVIFVCSHLFITFVGAMFWFGRFSIIAVVFGGIVVIISRYLNGRIILLSIHWHHYLIVIFIIAAASLLYPL